MFSNYGIDLKHLQQFNQMNPINQMTMMNNPNILYHSLQNFQSDINYYQESCKLYIGNMVLSNQIREVVSEKNELITKINYIENKINNQTKLNSEPQKKRRLRRLANEITKNYCCPMEICQKSYGSEGSLMQHIKLKHNEFYDNNTNLLQLLKKKNNEENSESNQKNCENLDFSKKNEEEKIYDDERTNLLLKNLKSEVDEKEKSDLSISSCDKFEEDKLNANSELEKVEKTINEKDFKCIDKKETVNEKNIILNKNNEGYEIDENFNDFIKIPEISEKNAELSEK